MAAQSHNEGQSVNRPPLFDGEDYTYWKTRMEYFLQGHDYQIWSIVEEGDLLVTNEKAQWTDDDRKKISQNCKAKSIMCCALNKKEFNKVSAYKSVMEMWEKLIITYEGTDKVKETRIDILVAQYERFQMQSGRPGGIQGAVPFGCEGRPGGVSRVVSSRLILKTHSLPLWARQLGNSAFEGEMADPETLVEGSDSERED
ncbi:hypothetical protein Taro_051881 [Colocasia esculenta]|uniref:DUF4219 domain-containing protein n=1 Tax=Colocasia esculenta TaxID=4460 RepID=A0A843XI30_COLES|nr:hypothetical protein [Colocasia esculenta]